MSSKRHRESSDLEEKKPTKWLTMSNVIPFLTVVIIVVVCWMTYRTNQVFNDIDCAKNKQKETIKQYIDGRFDAFEKTFFKQEQAKAELIQNSFVTKQEFQEHVNKASDPTLAMKASSPVFFPASRRS